MSPYRDMALVVTRTRPVRRPRGLVVATVAGAAGTAVALALGAPLASMMILLYGSLALAVVRKRGREPPARRAAVSGRALARERRRGRPVEPADRGGDRPAGR